MQRDPAQTAALVDLAFEGRLAGVAEPANSLSFSALETLRTCALSYALKYVCGLERPRTVPAFGFGSAAHEAFRAFTRLRRELAEAGGQAPGRSDLERCFEAAWADAELAPEAKAAWLPRAGPMLTAFLDVEAGRDASTLAEEVPFRFELTVPGDAPIAVSGCIDRIDRLPGGGIEVIDYKTGPAGWLTSPERSLQLGIYALACREALGLGTPEKATFYFVEHRLLSSASVSDERLERVRDELVVGARAVRGSAFVATSNPATCKWCDYAPLCSERAGR